MDLIRFYIILPDGNSAFYISKEMLQYSDFTFFNIVISSFTLKSSLQICVLLCIYFT